MNIESFAYDKFDIANLPYVVFRDNESVLSKSINLINHQLCELFLPKSIVLEVGCGRFSPLKSQLDSKIKWHGIDVYEIDDLGRKSIATEIGSVHKMPYKDAMFDYVIANQSLEHWFEYDVSIESAIQEMARVTKNQGIVSLDFPIHLHGDPLCLSGKIEIILEKLSGKLMEISSVVGYYDSSEADYKGWRRCGFPDFLITGNTSFVVQVLLKRNSVSHTNIKLNSKKIKKISDFKRISMYGFKYFFWKIITVFKGKLSSRLRGLI